MSSKLPGRFNWLFFVDEDRDDEVDDDDEELDGLNENDSALFAEFGVNSLVDG